MFFRANSTNASAAIQMQELTGTVGVRASAVLTLFNTGYGRQTNHKFVTTLLGPWRGPLPSLI